MPPATFRRRKWTLSATGNVAPPLRGSLAARCVPVVRAAGTLFVFACLFCTCLFCSRPTATRADELVLNNGLALRGVAARVSGLNATTARQNDSGPVPNTPYWMIDDKVRRYFVHRRQVAEFEAIRELSGVVSFKLEQQISRKGAGPAVIGGQRAEPFDQYGRRTVTLNTPKGKVDIIQGITELRPDYARVEGLNYSWELSLDTKTLPDEIIPHLIAYASNRDLPGERLAAVQFYIQADMYPQAQEEIRQLAERFPEQADRCAELQRRVAELNARRGINEVQRRRDAGQHALAYQIARLAPPDDISADVLQEVRGIVSDYETALHNRDRALLLLDMLQAELPLEQAQRLGPLRSVLTEELNYESIDRLTPFLRTEEDDSLTADQKLALAYSGWLLGADGAELDLNAAIRAWEMRFLILEYLRTDRDPLRDAETIRRLEAVEGATLERLSRMIGRLPPVFEPPQAVPGQVVEVAVPTGPEEPPTRYSLMLPPEYTPAHRYPLLVVLRGPTPRFEDELHWWAGDAERPGWAQRRGYVVIAPHYCEENAVEYAAGSAEQAVVIKSIEHVRQRLRIDSDRVFLAGHGMGADACFDIAMSRPDVFAGAIPITGLCDRFCRFYHGNATQVAWYVVSGERDRNSLEANAQTLNELMKAGNVIYCDYKNRGFESYHEELERIFEWMQVTRRPPLRDTVDWSAKSLRKSENRFYWMQARGLPDRLYPPVTWDKNSPRVAPALSGTITRARTDLPEDDLRGGAIYLRHPGTQTSLWLSPELVDFNRRYRIRVNGKWVYNDFPRPSAEALLSDLRERGDRERLFWTRLEF